MNVDSKLETVAGINQTDLSIFEQDWWLNIARGSSHYRELRVFDGGAVVGRLPYILSINRLGLFTARNLHWSRLGGPIVSEQLSRKEQGEVLGLLVGQLPRWSSIYFVCSPNTGYADLVRTAFKDAGFEHTIQVTYVRYPTHIDVMDLRKSKHRGHIRRAGKALDCVEISASEFVRFYETNLKARGQESYSPLDIVTWLTEEAISRRQARVIAARPKAAPNAPANERLSVPYDAAIVYVWDRSHCYYWMSTRRISSEDNTHPKPHPDAIKFLVVEAMRHAQTMKLIFDADVSGKRTMFGLEKEEHRDIFRRVTVIERLHQKYRSQIEGMIPK